jgi:hypothetical protein
MTAIPVNWTPFMGIPLRTLFIWRISITLRSVIWSLSVNIWITKEVSNMWEFANKWSAFYNEYADVVDPVDGMRLLIQRFCAENAHSYEEYTTMFEMLVDCYLRGDDI